MRKGVLFVYSRLVFCSAAPASDPRYPRLRHARTPEVPVAIQKQRKHDIQPYGKFHTPAAVYASEALTTRHELRTCGGNVTKKCLS